MLNPNYSEEAEQAVLQVVLMTDGGDLVETLTRMLKPEHFYFPAHADIWKSVLALSSGDLASDPVSVYEHNESLDIDYMVQLCSNYASSANAKHYAMIIKERHEIRSIISTLADSMAMISEVDKDWKTRKNEVAGKIDAAFNARDNGIKGLVHASGVAKSWLSGVVDMQEGKRPDGFTTGIPELDQMLAPKLLVPGSLVVVGARPKMGKSALLAKMTNHFSSTLGMASLVFSMEMSDEEVVERVITGQSAMSPAVFYKAMKPEQYHRLQTAVKHVFNSKLYIDDTPGLSIDHIKSECRRIARKERVGIIAVDYLTLMQAPKADRNDLAYGSITKQLKNLARELNCIVLLLTQLNRSLESRPNIMDRKPQPADSRDTGQIEQDCDVWMGLFRAGAYEQLPNPGLTELLVRLNRKGQTGSTFLDMREGYFESLDLIDAATMDHANVEKYQSKNDKTKAKQGYNG
jgi:replicative DNA helicase